MRGLLIVLAVVVLMAVGGWLIFNFDDNRVSVEFNSEKAQQDTSEAVDKAGDAIRDAGEAIERAAESAGEAASEEPAVEARR